MRTHLVAAAACCLALTACADSPEPSAAPSASAQAVPSAKPSVEPSSKPSASEKPSPKPTAKDGTDFKACVDAKCQVLLKSKTDFTPAAKFGVVRIFLTHKNPNRLEFLVVRRNVNEVQGYLGGEGYLSLAGSMTIKVEHHDRGGAILRFEPKAANRKSDTLSASDGGSIFG